MRLLPAVSIGLTMAACAMAEPGTVSLHPRQFTSHEGGIIDDVGLTMTNGCEALIAFESEDDGSHLFVLAVRADTASEPAPELRAVLGGNTIGSAAMVSTNWITHAWPGELQAGLHLLRLVMPAEGVSAAVQVHSLTVVSPGRGVVTVVDEAGLEQALEAQRTQRFARFDERIDQHRRGTLRVRVADAAGRPVAGSAVTVRQLQHEFLFGTMLASQVFEEGFEPSEKTQYLDAVKTHFNSASTRDALVWRAMEPERGRVNYRVVDAMLAWCRDHNLPLRGDGVFCDKEDQIPDWVRGLSDGELRNAIGLRARVIAARYKGAIDEMDINDGMVRHSYLQGRLGSGIRRQEFHEMRAANPRAVLYVNECGVLSGSARDDFMQYVRGLLNSDVPVAGVGVTGRFESTIDADAVERALDEVAKLGLPVKITGYACLVDDEQVQADCLETLYRVAFANAAVAGITLGGFWEKVDEYPQAALLRNDFSRRPAGDVHERLVKKEWWTAEDGASDGEGLFQCRPFLGRHEITVAMPGGGERKVAVSVTRTNREATVDMVLPSAP